jgi:hypothetical protein
MDKTQGWIMQSRPCFKLTHYIFKAAEKKVSQRQWHCAFAASGQAGRLKTVLSLVVLIGRKTRKGGF